MHKQQNWLYVKVLQSVLLIIIYILLCCYYQSRKLSKLCIASIYSLEMLQSKSEDELVACFNFLKLKLCQTLSVFSLSLLKLSHHCTCFSPNSKGIKTVTHLETKAIISCSAVKLKYVAEDSCNKDSSPN